MCSKCFLSPFDKAFRNITAVLGICRKSRDELVQSLPLKGMSLIHGMRHHSQEGPPLVYNLYRFLLLFAAAQHSCKNYLNKIFQ